MTKLEFSNIQVRFFVKTMCNLSEVMALHLWSYSTVSSLVFTVLRRYKLAGRWGPSPGAHPAWGGGSGGWHWWESSDGWGSWGPPSKLSVPRAT